MLFVNFQKQFWSFSSREAVIVLVSNQEARVLVTDQKDRGFLGQKWTLTGTKGAGAGLESLVACFQKRTQKGITIFSDCGNVKWSDAIFNPLKATGAYHTGLYST